MSDSEIHSGETPMVVNRPDSSPRPQRMRSALAHFYTFAFASAIVLVSLAGADQQVPLVHKRGHLFFYSFTIASEFVILALAYVGIRFSGMRLAEVIGGKWKAVEDFLLDVGLGFGFSIFLLIVVASLGLALGLNRPGVVDPGKKVILAIAPKTPAELALFFSLSITAGLVEEIVFRGYLQKQFGRLFGNVWIGMFLSAILFGLSHGYEGKQRMCIIVVLGVLFGSVAILRKSLRTGMIAHALFDGIVGAVAMFALKSGMLK